MLNFLFIAYFVKRNRDLLRNMAHFPQKLIYSVLKYTIFSNLSYFGTLSKVPFQQWRQPPSYYIARPPQCELIHPSFLAKMSGNKKITNFNSNKVIKTVNIVFWLIIYPLRSKFCSFHCNFHRKCSLLQKIFTR